MMKSISSDSKVILKCSGKTSDGVQYILIVFILNTEDTWKNEIFQKIKLMIRLNPSENETVCINTHVYQINLDYM